MASKTYWLEEPIIVCHEMRGRYTAQELRAGIGQELVLAGQSPEDRVYVLRDLSELDALPPDFKLTAEMAQKVLDSKIEYIASVDPNRLMRFMIKVTSHSVPLPIKVFDDRAQAKAFLRQMIEADHQAALNEAPETEE